MDPDLQDYFHILLKSAREKLCGAQSCLDEGATERQELEEAIVRINEVQQSIKNKLKR